MSYFSCDFCFAKSTRHVESAAVQDEGGFVGRKKGKVDKRIRPKGATHVYPAGTRAELRTHDRHIELAARTGPTKDEKEYTA